MVVVASFALESWIACSVCLLLMTKLSVDLLTAAVSDVIVELALSLSSPPLAVVVEFSQRVWHPHTDAAFLLVSYSPHSFFAFALQNFPTVSWPMLDPPMPAA